MAELERIDLFLQSSLVQAFDFGNHFLAASCSIVFTGTEAYDCVMNPSVETSIAT